MWLIYVNICKRTGKGGKRKRKERREEEIQSYALFIIYFISVIFNMRVIQI
jgi:hypothetical protein